MSARAVSVRPTSRRSGFDKDAYNRFKLAMRFGEAISAWDDPQVAPAGGAAHMRDDDYVIGVVFRGRARAYPLWVVDNYHVVNDRVDGERLLLVSCERCQSGAAFLPAVEGNPDREPLFRSVGFLNATLLLKDLRSGSHWVHYNGHGLDRKAAGVDLPWIPTYHMEWQDWVRLHPDTEVMLPPEDPRHPDARHGHGREEMFARPGMDPSFIPTILGDLDDTYPENEMVLGIAADPGGEPSWIAYPLREVQREGGVVEEDVGGRKVAVLAGPRADGFTMAAFVSSAAGRDLSFVRDDGAFRDVETGSTWTIEGVAVRGPLAGTALEPVRWSYVRWHAWIYFHPETRLFRSGLGPRPFRPGDATGVEQLDAVLSALAAAGHDVRIGEPLVSQRRPRESRHSLTTYVDGDAVVLHLFGSEAAARDFHEFDAAWSGYPIKPRSHEGRTRRLGRVVLESDPPKRYVDPANVVPVPPAAIAWAAVLDSPLLDEVATSLPAGGMSEASRGFLEVVRALRLSGHEVIDIGFLPPGQLRVGAVNGIALTVDAERFLLYRFATPALASAYAETEEHSIVEGEYVIRSTPDTMYEHQAAEILYAGDDRIRWSRLLGEPGFGRAFREAVGGSR